MLNKNTIYHHQRQYMRGHQESPACMLADFKAIPFIENNTKVEDLASTLKLLFFNANPPAVHLRKIGNVNIYCDKQIERNRTFVVQHNGTVLDINLGFYSREVGYYSAVICTCPAIRFKHYPKLSIDEFVALFNS
jgi:hypothetical protein